MSDFQDAFNQNNGLNNAMGNLAAINQRNQQIAQQKEQAAAIRAQTAVLEQQAKTEADRAKIEQQRLAIEQQRQRAEEAEREMRRQQEEQLKQLRNLIADSDADLERLEKKANTLNPDAFLRGVAALQANVQILDAESGALSDLSDMKALRQLKSQLAESIETNAQSGKLPADPLGVIANRLIKLDGFFKEAQSVADRVLEFRSDWLKPGIPAVSKADLLAAQVELAALQTKLPQEFQQLSILLDSADWTSVSGIADLYPEYLVCLECLDLTSVPHTANVRMELAQFARGEGPLVEKVGEHIAQLGQRIESLLAQHEEHRVQLEQVDAHNRAENFRSAAKVAAMNDAKSRFSDLPYAQMIQQTQAHFQHLERIQDIHYLLDEDLKQRTKQGLPSELTCLENGVKFKDSELGRECLVLTDAIRQRMAKLKRSQRNQWLEVGAIAAAVILVLLCVWLVQAETEKKRVIAEAAVEKVRVEAARIAQIKREEALAEDAKRPAGGKREFEIAEGVKLTMCWIPAGEFVMGSSKESDAMPHPVKLTQGFWLSQTEVTQAQWRAVMGNNPSSFQGDDLPLESVSWDDICGNEARTGGFLGKLNELQANGGRFDLPTEAQWEYACRAGNTGDDEGDLGEKAWYSDNSELKTHPVGQKQANAWGLHDMQGNVLEWCADWKADYPTSAVIDPTGPASGSARVYRGGGWSGGATYCRVADRNYYYPSYTDNGIGFRVARSSVPQ
jgi:formylglycine-generating enzyme required for sulfatase activity